MYRPLSILLLTIFLFACSRTEPDMYEASPLAATMRQMVEFSKASKLAIKESKTLDVPQEFLDLTVYKGTKDEHLDPFFQTMAKQYANNLRRMEGDSFAFYYQQSIKTCITCHQQFCGGPLVIIEKLQLQ